MTSSKTEILEQFIEDESLHYPRGDQGSYFPSNHHRITPLVAQASKLLPRDRRVDLYFHLLRLNHYPMVKSAAEFDVVLEAYARLKPLFQRGYPIAPCQGRWDSFCLARMTAVSLLENHRSPMSRNRNL